MYQYTNPKMQEVAKLCEKGFWPICKNERGQFAIFMPILNVDKFIRRSSWSSSLEIALNTCGTTYQDDGVNYEPTEIVGFCHPPTPKFEVGDKVRVREDLKDCIPTPKKTGYNYLKTAGKIGKVTRTEGSHFYKVDFENDSWSYLPLYLEPVIETEPKVVEMTFAEIEEKLGVKNLKIVK